MYPYGPNFFAFVSFSSLPLQTGTQLFFWPTFGLHSFQAAMRKNKTPTGIGSQKWWFPIFYNNLYIVVLVKRCSVALFFRTTQIIKVEIIENREKNIRIMESMEKNYPKAKWIFSFFSGGKIFFPTWEFVEIFPIYFPNLLINLRPLISTDHASWVGSEPLKLPP